MNYKGDDDGIIDTSISCDESKQRGVISSLNGVVAIISITDIKAFDIQPMSESYIPVFRQYKYFLSTKEREGNRNCFK